MPELDSVFAELFHTYHRSLINFCISQGIRQENVDDIVSEAFTRAIAKADQFLPLEPKQQKAWLYSAVVNIIKENRAKPTHIVFSEIENIENFIQDNDDLKQYQSEEKYQLYIREIYDELEIDKERDLFRLIFDRKIDYATLSRKYDVSPVAARVMVSRLRKKLRIIVNKLLSE